MESRMTKPFLYRGQWKDRATHAALDRAYERQIATAPITGGDRRARRCIVARAPRPSVSTARVPGSGTSDGGGRPTATGGVAVTEPVPYSNALPARGPE